jgi:hypothetical protein
MADGTHADALKAKLASEYERLEHAHRVGPFVSVGKRFVDIDGHAYGGLLAIELFTTVLPR